MKTLKEKGFTVIELMATIVVAAILITMAVPSFLGMLDRNKVVATTNELVGLIQYAKSTAKMANKPTAVFDCATKTLTDCDIGVAYIESINADGLIRVMRWPTNVKVTSKDPAQTAIAFYPDGTRGIHGITDSVSKFDDNGAFTGNADTLSNFGRSGDFNWQVRSGDYCRNILITTVGQVTVTEGCENGAG